jgi:hypothetical protein
MNDEKRPQRRPYISVFFRCCGVYTRVYRHRDGGRYEGRCPRCLAKVVVPIGEGGTSQRIFEAE